MRTKMMRRRHALAVLRKSKHTPVERTRTKISIFPPIDGHALTHARVPCFAELDATRSHQSLSARQVERMNRMQPIQGSENVFLCGIEQKNRLCGFIVAISEHVLTASSSFLWRTNEKRDAYMQFC